MHLARVIGSVHATVKDPNVEQARLLVLRPIATDRRADGDELVAVDTVGAGPGDIVFYTTAYEAVMPWKRLRPGIDMALVDAGIIGIVDRIDGPRSSS